MINIGNIEGIEFLDRHIPGFPNGNMDQGIKDFIDVIVFVVFVCPLFRN